MNKSLLPSWPALLLALLALAGSFADARRSGGGFGGSRSFGSRSSPFRSSPTVRTPTYRAPSYTAPRLNPPTQYGYRPRNNFFFLPFFGFHPFGWGYGYGAPSVVPGFFSLILNLVVVIAVIALVVWLIRRMRRS